MKKYRNLQGHSGVIAYELKPHGIRVQFTNGSIYYYTENSTGKKNIQKMKKLAENGEGLSTFISQVIKDKFAKKES